MALYNKRTKISSTLSATQLDLNGLLFTEYFFKSLDDISFAPVRQSSVYFIIDGEYNLKTNRKEFTCSGGQIIFINDEIQLPLQSVTANTKLFSFQINAEWCRKFEIEMPDLTTQEFLQGSFLNSIVSLLYKEYILNDDYSPLAMQGIFLQIIAALKREETKTQLSIPQWVNKLKQIIFHQFADKLSLEFLSKQLDVHPVHLSKYFPKYFNCSLGEFIRRIKVEQSAILLADQKLSLTEISYQCGFSDQSHFIRLFKKHTGITPLQYRNAILKC